MYRINDDLSIYVTRGDIVLLSVSAEDKDGKPYTFVAGDVVRIKVFKKKKCTEVALEKDFPVTSVTQSVQIFLSGEDTKIGEVISKPVDYWYEVELNPYSEPQTIIGYDEDGAKVFKLFPEGADKELEEYEPNEDDLLSRYMDDELDLTSKHPVENRVIARAILKIEAECEATHNAVTKLHVTPEMFGAIGDGKTDDTEAFKKMIATGKKMFIPTGDYLIFDTLDCTGLSIEGDVDTYIHFANTSGDGLVCGYGTIRNLNIVMENGFTGSLLKVYEDKVEGYPDHTLVWGVNLYSLNEDYTGTFMHVKPYNNFGGVIEKVKIGRISRKIKSQANNAQRGLYIEIADGTWATGYSFKDISIDAYTKQPLTLTAPDYYACMNFSFDNVQIQNKHNSIGFKHDYLARFKGVQDLYVINCKIWDFSYDYCGENVIYADCTNVVVRNSPVFEKYYNNKNPFAIEGSALGLKESQKLYNSDFSRDNGFVGMSEVINIGGVNSQAVPYIIPHDYSYVLHSKLIFDLWSVVNYGMNRGDTTTHVEMVQTNYANHIVYMHSARSLPIIKKVKKYKEGLVVWIRGGVGDVNVSYVAGGKMRVATGEKLTLWEGSAETASVETWSDTEVIPKCASMTILYGTSIDANTTLG
jgi:hypothetical protein